MKKAEQLLLSRLIIVLNEFLECKWQKLTFKIPENRTAIINNILVAPHAHDAGQPVVFTTHRVYWDELIALPKE